MTYHLVSWPVLVCARISTCSQVPAGAAAVQEATSSFAPKPIGWTGAVHRAYSQVLVPSPKGSV
jgi:hypothetical protein